MLRELSPAQTSNFSLTIFICLFVRQKTDQVFLDKEPGSKAGMISVSITYTRLPYTRENKLENVKKFVKDEPKASDFARFS
jgi:hypothetical protein